MTDRRISQAVEEYRQGIEDFPSQAEKIRSSRQFLDALHDELRLDPRNLTNDELLIIVENDFPDVPTGGSECLSLRDVAGRTLLNRPDVTETDLRSIVEHCSADVEQRARKVGERFPGFVERIGGISQMYR